MLGDNKKTIFRHKIVPRRKPLNDDRFVTVTIFTYIDAGGYIATIRVYIW